MDTHPSVFTIDEALNGHLVSGATDSVTSSPQPLLNPPAQRLSEEYDQTPTGIDLDVFSWDDSNFPLGTPKPESGLDADEPLSVLPKSNVESTFKRYVDEGYLEAFDRKKAKTEEDSGERAQREEKDPSEEVAGFNRLLAELREELDRNDLRSSKDYRLSEDGKDRLADIYRLLDEFFENPGLINRRIRFVLTPKGVKEVAKQNGQFMNENSRNGHGVALEPFLLTDGTIVFTITSIFGGTYVDLPQKEIQIRMRYIEERRLFRFHSVEEDGLMRRNDCLFLFPEEIESIDIPQSQQKA